MEKKKIFLRDFFVQSYVTVTLKLLMVETEVGVYKPKISTLTSKIGPHKPIWIEETENYINFLEKS